MSFVGKASEIDHHHHAMYSYVAAGGTLLPADVDPFPNITYECNGFVGKERWIYRLKLDLALIAGKSAPADWMIVRDLPLERRRSWDNEQLAMAVGQVDELVAQKQQTRQQLFDATVSTSAQILTYEHARLFDPFMQIRAIDRALWPEEIRADFDAKAVLYIALRDEHARILEEARARPPITANDLTAEEVFDCYTSYGFEPKPAWMDVKPPEDKPGFIARMWKLLGGG